MKRDPIDVAMPDTPPALTLTAARSLLACLIELDPERTTTSGADPRGRQEAPPTEKERGHGTPRIAA